MQQGMTAGISGSGACGDGNRIREPNKALHLTANRCASHQQVTSTVRWNWLQGTARKEANPGGNTL